MPRASIKRQMATDGNSEMPTYCSALPFTLWERLSAFEMRELVQGQ
jgi:hypothetical protein